MLPTCLRLLLPTCLLLIAANYGWASIEIFGIFSWHRGGGGTGGEEAAEVVVLGAKCAEVPGLAGFGVLLLFRVLLP